MGCTITAEKAQFFGKQAVSSSMQKVMTDTRINKFEKNWFSTYCCTAIKLAEKNYVDSNLCNRY